MRLSATLAARLAALACALACATGLAAALARSADLACTLACAATAAEADDGPFTPAQINKGAGIYERTCAPCHGPRMADPQGAANLRAFPRDQKSRFILLVTKGKNNMPPWGDVLRPDDLEALWAYVIAGER